MSERGDWTLRAALARTIGRFREDAASLPARAWKVWSATVVAGYVVVLLLMFGLVQAGRALSTNGILAWEEAFLLRLEAELPLSYSSAVWVQTFGTDITLIILALFTAVVAIWARRPVHALGIVVALVGLDLAVRFGWLLWDRARPDVILDGIAAPGFASYPSGHTAKSLVVYGYLAFLWVHATTSRIERPLAVALTTGLVLLVMVGRLRMGVHWPSDVVAGAFIGGAWLGIVASALVRAERIAALEGEEAPEAARG